MSNRDAGTAFTSDAQNVYAVELAGVRGRPKLKNLTRVETGTDLRETVLKLVQKTGLRGRRAVLALPGHDAIVRCFEMPLIPRREVPNAVRFEAQKYMPFDIKDLYFDYEIHPDPEQRKLRVVFLAAKKELIDRWIGALTAAGVEVEAVEPDLMALLRVSETRRGRKDHEAHALISARSDGSLDVAVVKNNQPLMARYGSVVYSSVQGDASFAVNFETFAKEIALSFNYFSKNLRGEEIRRIFWLADPDFDSQNWIQGLRTCFDIPVEMLDLSDFLGNSNAAAPTTAVLVGAALRKDDALARFFGKKKANLLPVTVESAPLQASSKTPEEEKKVLLKWGIQTAAAALFLILIVHAFLAPKTSVQKKGAGEPYRSMTDLNEIHKKMTEKTVFLSSLLDERLYWTDKMSAIARSVPDEIVLKLVEASDPDQKRETSVARLRIEGVVRSSGAGNELEIVNRFVERLSAEAELMKGFDAVTLSQVRKESDEVRALAEVMSFTIEFSAKK